MKQATISTEFLVFENPRSQIFTYETHLRLALSSIPQKRPIMQVSKSIETQVKTRCGGAQKGRLEISCKEQDQLVFLESHSAFPQNFYLKMRWFHEHSVDHLRNDVKPRLRCTGQLFFHKPSFNAYFNLISTF